MQVWQALKEGIINGDTRSLARAITLVENEAPGYEAFLESLPVNQEFIKSTSVFFQKLA